MFQKLCGARNEPGDDDASKPILFGFCLLAQHGFVYLEAPFVVQLLPAMLAVTRGTVFNGIPPSRPVRASARSWQVAATWERFRIILARRSPRSA